MHEAKLAFVLSLVGGYDSNNVVVFAMNEQALKFKYGRYNTTHTLTHLQGFTNNPIYIAALVSNVHI